MPEIISNTNNTNSDNNQIKLILNELNLNYIPTKLHRLGRPTNKDRPLKVTFLEVNYTFDILRAQSKLCSSSLWSNIKIASDRTEKQRKMMSNLRKELESRRNEGEKDIIIKYIKGIPTIINSKNLLSITPFTFSLYYQNVRGLNTKINQLNKHIASSTFDIFVFTETWLSD